MIASSRGQMCRPSTRWKMVRHMVQVLELVEHDQHPLRSDKSERLRRRIVAGIDNETHRVGDGIHHLVRVGDLRERHEPHPIGMVGGYVLSDGHRQPRLADATRSHDREQSTIGVAEELGDRSTSLAGRRRASTGRAGGPAPDAADSRRARHVSTRCRARPVRRRTDIPSRVPSESSADLVRCHRSPAGPI